MNHKKLAQLVDVASLKEYKEANLRFREACREYTKVRLISDKKNPSVEDIVKHHNAKEEYKEACKEFHNAREKFIRAARGENGDLSVSDSEYIAIAESTKLKDVKKVEGVQYIQDVYKDVIAEMKELNSLPEEINKEAKRLIENGFKVRSAIDMAKEAVEKNRRRRNISPITSDTDDSAIYDDNF